MWDSKGYENDQGGFFNTSTAESPEEKQKEIQRKQNIAPVCVRQILESAEDKLKIGSRDIHMFTMVVLLRRIEIQSTKVTYLMDDGTGGIQGIFWIDTTDNEAPRALPDVVENMYCRIFGSMRTNQGKKHVFIYKISRLTSLNDLTRHILEVIHCPLKLQLLASTESAKAAAKKNDGDVSMSNSFMSTSAPDPTGFNAQQTLVYNAIMKNSKDIGAHRDEIVKELEGKLSAKVVINIVDFLSNEGHIYTTIDDDHYRCTDN